jgi:endonuclease/exonuclease/phosphatase family metal-dependent hydrolase
MELMTYAPFRFDGEMWDRGAAAPVAEPIDLRIVTWNVWFGPHMFRARGRALLDELERRRADVIALQEVTSPLLAAIHGEPWIRAAYQVSELDLLGYDVVILSRVPIVEMMTLPLPTRMGRRLLVARLACGLDVATVHLESMRDSAPERAEQLRIIQPLLAGASEDAVLVGDMNFEPEAPLEHAARDPSFVDVWPSLRPDEPGFSVDSQHNPMRMQVLGKETRKRIDRVFARTRRWRPSAIELLGTVPIDGAGTFISDHFGLQVELAAR